MPAKNQTQSDQWGEKISTDLEFRKTSALEDGQSIEGTVVAFKESTKFPGTVNLIMRGSDGNNFTLSPSGNLKYAIRDGLLKVGNTYKIQKEGTKKIKGMTSGVFGVYPSKNNPTPNATSSDLGSSDEI